jgi:hypothetical protein
MVPSQAPIISTISEPLTALTPSKTAPASNVRNNAAAPERTLLAPEDAIYQVSPPRKLPNAAEKILNDLRMTNGDSLKLHRRARHKDGHRTSSRRRKGAWKKLLWVKQSCALPLQSTAWQLLIPRQIRTTTPIKIPSSNTSNEILVSNLTTSGPSSRIPQSLCNTSARS